MTKQALIDRAVDWGVGAGLFLVGASIVSMCVSCAVWLWRQAFVCGVGF